MQIKCVVIDDEPLAIELIKNYIKQFPELELLAYFDDAIAGKEFLQNNKIDLLFIDINMPEITGIQVVQSLEPRPLFIFTTAYKQFALEGFNLDAVDYLVKPISLGRFNKAIEKATRYLGKKEHVLEDIYVRSEYQMVKIALDDIEYIRSMEDYLKIFLTNGRPVMTLMTFKALQEKLPADRFIRIHRSFIVPVSKIQSVVNRTVKLPSVELPVSNSYLSEIKKLVEK